MNRWFLVIDGRVQPIPFNTQEDALDELEVIREKTLVCTWEVIPEDDSRLAKNNSSASLDNGFDSPRATLKDFLELAKAIVFLIIALLIYGLFKGE